MDSIQTPGDRPVIVTVCADSGMGKTSFAATFPKPIFVRAEDGLQAIPQTKRPDAFPLIQEVGDLWAQLAALCNDPHDYQTVVIDSVTALERLFIHDIMSRPGEKASSINQALGGYGAGPAAVAAMHQRVRKAAGILNERRGMHVVFVAHADVETMKLPDSDDYQRYSLRLPSKSQPPYVDDVDIVGFIKLTMFTRGEDGERKKAISTGEREMICHAAAANVSKNRFGITDPLPLPIGQNVLAEFVPSLNGETMADGPVFVRPASNIGENEEELKEETA